jgi:glyceraldehyde-3-phosphate dehydrogenase (NAD(P))
MDAGRPRGDLWENCVWADSVAVRGRDLYLFQAIHQESDVVPENVDAIRAITGAATAAESVALTDETLGVGFRSWAADADGAEPRHAPGAEVAGDRATADD